MVSDYLCVFLCFLVLSDVFPLFSVRYALTFYILQQLFLVVHANIQFLRIVDLVLIMNSWIQS